MRVPRERPEGHERTKGMKEMNDKRNDFEFVMMINDKIINRQPLTDEERNEVLSWKFTESEERMAIAVASARR